MQIELIGNDPVVFGLAWKSPGETAATALVARIKNRRVIQEAVVSTDDYDEIMSALCLLASAMPTGAVIAIRELQNGTFWLASLNNGMPVFGGEHICTADEVANEAARMATMLTVKSILIDVQTTSALADLSSKPLQAWSLAELLEPDESWKRWLPFWPSHRSKATFKAIGKERGGGNTKYIIGSLVMLGAVGYHWYDVKQQEEAERQRQAELAKQALENGPEPTLRKAINAVLAQNAPIRSLIALYPTHVGAMPTSKDGWRLVDASCVMQKQNCEFGYSRDRYAADNVVIDGTHEDLAQRSPGHRTLVSSYILPPLTLKPTDPIADAAIRFGDGTNTGTIAFEHLLNDDMQVRPGTAGPIENGANLPNVTVRTQKFTVSGNLAILPAVLDAGLPSGALASKLTITALNTATPTFTIDGVLLSITDLRGAKKK